MTAPVPRLPFTEVPVRARSARSEHGTPPAPVAPRIEPGSVDDPVAVDQVRWERSGMEDRMLVVDDHASFRSIARRVLAADGFVVVGEAADGAAAIRACEELRPDVVLLDVQLPDTDGFAVAAAIAAGVDPPPVVLVSSRSRADYGSRIEDCGARGFIAKAELSGSAVRLLLPGPVRGGKGNALRNGPGAHSGVGRSPGEGDGRR